MPLQKAGATIYGRQLLVVLMVLPTLEHVPLMLSPTLHPGGCAVEDRELPA